ncbi:MAG: threonine dehydratase [Candidatus Eremiobacteraeota bacterium]|jgi:threonine dehydratase|nr:threonine dehydratase [Candidatus Eremiobacteraeota bacterium]
MIARTAPFDLTLAEIDGAAGLIRDAVPPTPAYRWPLLCQRLAVEMVLKHENHTPLGAFKLRGGLTYLAALRERAPHVRRVVSATRGNHGQSIAFAASRAGLRATIVVPEGNSPEKNAAMRALGAELIVHGRDFDDAKAHAAALVDSDEHAEFVPSYHRDLVLGVATYARELFASGSFDVVYVPIGLGSGISGVITVRDLLGLDTEVVGVVSDRFPAYALSFARGQRVETDPAESVADGMAVRVPDEAALAVIRAGAARIETVSEEAVREAMRWIFTDTHNVAEGAAAAAVAAVAADREALRGKRVAAIVSGGNVDAAVFAKVLA